MRAFQSAQDMLMSSGSAAANDRKSLPMRFSQRRLQPDGHDKCTCRSGIHHIQLLMQLAAILFAGQRWPSFLLQNAWDARESKNAAGLRLGKRPSAVRRAHESTEHDALRRAIDGLSGH